MKRKPKPSVEDRDTVVYRAYDQTGELIYVGITCDFEKRMQQHESCTSWWRDEVWSVETDDYPSRQLARGAERQLIGRNNPRRNVPRADSPAFVVGVCGP